MTNVATSKIKLLYLVAEDWAFMTHRVDLAIAAKNAGFDVSVATRVVDDSGQINVLGLKLLPIKFDRSRLNLAREAVTLMRLVAFYRRERPDIVHHFGLKPILYGSIAARAAGVRAIVNGFGGLGYVFRSQKLAARILIHAVKPALKLALAAHNTCVIVENGDDERLLLDIGIAQKSNIKIIPGAGVNLSLYPPTMVDVETPLVICPARLLYEKGIVEFVTAAHRLKSRGVKARFVCVGKRDPSNPACIGQEQIDRWVREADVEFWGWRSDMPQIYGQAQIVCLPSYHEGLPKVLLEGAASGCALVASDIPGCRDVARHGTTGWLVPVKDATALADALQQAIERPDLRAKYGAAARALVVQEMTLERVVDLTLGVYRELLNERPPLTLPV